MSATLILSVILIWVMACSVCMLWFGSATQHTNPRNCEVQRHPRHSATAVVWGAVFAICAVAWLLIRWWAGH